MKQREHFLTILRADLTDDSNLKAARWCRGWRKWIRGRSEDRKQRAGAGNEDAYTQLFT
jgi:hypothetical protein